MSKQRLFGATLLVYAFLASTFFLSIGPVGRRESINAVIALLYALGGFGFLFEKRWGRVFTVLAAGGSLIAIVGGIVFLPTPEIGHIVSIIMLIALPALAILVTALLVKTPPSLEATHRPSISKRALSDVAYIAFIFLGLISLWTSYLVLSEIQAAGGGTSGVAGIVGFGVLIPFGIPLLLTLIVGPAIAVFLWRDYRLISLTVFSIAVVIGVHTLKEGTWLTFLLPYGAISTVTGIIWFTKYRKHF